MIIIGAGMAGLLCSILNPGAKVYEINPKDQITHKALIRMKTNEISKFTGIDFKKVTVNKAIWYEGKEVEPSIRLMHLYSDKVIGQYTKRSIIDISPCIRYIPPSDFITQLQNRATKDIFYDTPINSLSGKTDSVISTIPMPILSQVLKINIECNFTKKEIFVDKFVIRNCDSYCTIYYPNPETSVYRSTLDGDVLTIESMGIINPEDINMVVDSLGISNTTLFGTENNHRQVFGKITEIDEIKRRKFILDATIKYNVFSLGRFATWRPKVMMDDVINDIFVINKLIAGGNYSTLRYQHK